MIRMTGPARHAWIFLQLVTVQRSWIRKLGSYICMALHAAISHRRLLPEEGMAG
jgi:hypothetical protein